MAIMCICVHKLVDSGENCAKELSCGFVQGLWVHLLPFWCIVQTKQHHLIRLSVVDPQSNVFPSILTFGSRFFPHRLSTSSTGLSPEPTAVHRSIFNPLTIFRCCALWHLSARAQSFQNNQPPPPPPNRQQCTGPFSTVHPHPSDPPVYPHGLQQSSTIQPRQACSSHNSS